jgi:hypothetical protein
VRSTPASSAIDDGIPPGWDYNPSSWPNHLPGLLLGLAGLGIAGYLALFQLGVLAEVWEPFFGSGSRFLLRESAIARLLPVPDAALGALAYLADVLADSFGGPARWRTAPWAVVLLGVVSGSLGAGGIVLAVCQPLLAGTYCTLCLASALCSVLILGATLDEVLACLQHLRRRTAAGHPLWRALRGQA